MANILITTNCNRFCSYCFAKEELRRSGEHSITLGDLDKVIGFLKRSNLKIAGVLGGEPTLHPQFEEVMNRLFEAGLEIKLFTGGLVPRRAVEYLKTCDPSKLRVLFNVPSRDEDPTSGEFDHIAAIVRELAPFSALGYTIHQACFDLSSVVNLALETNCRTDLRLGLGVPVANSPDPLIDPRDYAQVAKHVLRAAELCERHGFRLGFDCGFCFCMFTPEELGYLRAWNCKAEFACTPIVDIGPTLDVWSCFPLAPLLKTRLEKFETRQDVVQFFADRFRAYRTFGVHEQCHDCKFKARRQCAGGCLSATIRTFAPVNSRAH